MGEPTLREKFLNRSRELKRVPVTDKVDGTVYEVVTPTMGARGRIIKAGGGDVSVGEDGKEKVSGINGTEMSIQAVLECTYYPGTDKPVFGSADRDSLRNCGSDDKLLNELGETAMKLMRGAEKAAPNSEATQPEGSSSASPS